jgi:chromosome segregation ATPase
MVVMMAPIVMHTRVFSHSRSARGGGKFACATAMIAAACLALFTASSACAQSLEDRLRDQLRATLNQLHELQDQQATLQAQKATAEQERDALKAQLAKAETQVAHVGESAAVKAQARALASEVEKYKEAANQATGTAQQAQADHDKLETALADAQKQLGICADENAKLLKVGNEILDAYQQFDVGEAIAANEPFISIHRVELENMAQDFDDRLREGKFNPNAKQPSSSVGKVQ